MDLKKLAAQKAIEYVQNGMVLGLGTGTTVFHFITILGEMLANGELNNIIAVPTSESTASLAHSLHIPLTSLSKYPSLDLAVDGADEVDPHLNLIKGLGKALLREKVVESHANQFIVIVDESKVVQKLGQKQPLPVEIIQFEADAHVRWLNTLGCKATLWLEDDGKPVITDNGNFLARCWFNHNSGQGINNPYQLARTLAERAGIVEHGLFLDMAERVIVAGINGLQILER